MVRIMLERVKLQRELKKLGSRNGPHLYRKDYFKYGPALITVHAL
jgi:hypothetical protein